MYYSSRGVSFNHTYKSCNRFPLFQELLQTVDLTKQVSVPTLSVVGFCINFELVQVRGAAGLLQIMGRPSGIITEAEVEELSNIAVDEYMTVAAKMSLANENCEYETRLVRAPLEIIAILDATWDHYRTRQLLS